MRLKMEEFIKERQAQIVAALEAVDGKKFLVDSWDRPDHGGGGISCVLQEGNVFEKAGVNISIVYGKLPRPAILRMRADHKNLDPNVESLDFFAAGLSMVLHPLNPMAPTVHLNYRYFETMRPDGTTQSWWFGGGTDLTPSYLFDEDVIHFHRTIKEACDKHDKDYYTKYKKWCDEYFSVKHRGECRGVGGIFFDDLDDKDPEQLFSFVRDCLDAFLPSYLPIIEKRKVRDISSIHPDFHAGIYAKGGDVIRICHIHLRRRTGSNYAVAAMLSSTWFTTEGRSLGLTPLLRESNRESPPSSSH